MDPDDRHFIPAVQDHGTRLRVKKPGGAAACLIFLCFYAYTAEENCQHEKYDPDIFHLLSCFAFIQNPDINHTLKLSGTV